MSAKRKSNQDVPASQVAFKGPDKGPVICDSGNIGEPVVNCCISKPAG